MNYVEKLMAASFEDRMEAISMLTNSVEKDLEMYAATLGYKITKEDKGVEIRTVEKIIEVPVENTKLTEEYEQLEKAYDQLAKDYNNRCERIEDLKEENEELKEELTTIKHMANKYANELIKEREVKEVKEETKEQPKAKATKNYRLINCGPNKGEDEVVFIEKRKDNLHLWYGQIRIDNEIRNFHWSNELQKPVVYGVNNLASLTTSNELIREAVNTIDSKELTKYDMVPDHPDFGGFKARHYYGALEQGAYIYMTPLAQEDGKEEDIVFKGYINKHAFVVWRNGEVRFRHYNYINMKKPFEKHASKGFNTEQMLKDIDTLSAKVLEQFEKAASKGYRRNAVDNNATAQGTAQNTNDNKVDNTIDGLSNADIGGLF